MATRLPPVCTPIGTHQRSLSAPDGIQSHPAGAQRTRRAAGTRPATAQRTRRAADTHPATAQRTGCTLGWEPAWNGTRDLSASPTTNTHEPPAFGPVTTARFVST